MKLPDHHRYPLLCLFVMAFLITAPSAVAQGDPQLRDDAKECFEAIERQSGNGTCSVLYMHMDGLMIATLNVQELPDLAPDRISGGMGADGIRLKPNMGRIDWQEDGSAEGANLGGPAVAVELVPEVPIQGFWYMAADSSALSPVGNGTGEDGVGVMPCVTVEMLLVDHGKPLEGRDEVVARGQTTHTIVSPEDAGPVPVEEPCEDAQGPVSPSGVHEFRVLLEPVVEAPVTLGGFSLHVLWYQVDPSGDPFEPDKVAQPGWEIRAGAAHRPRLVLPVGNPTDVASTMMWETTAGVAASAVLRSPWGSYEFAPDVADGRDAPTSAVADRLRFFVLDEDGDEVPGGSVKETEWRYYPGHVMAGDDRLNVTYLWHPDPELEPGSYTLVIEADNHQGTSMARAEFSYAHAPATPQAAPVLEAALFLGTLLAMLLVVHRRRS